MESVFLNTFFDKIKVYNKIWIYGAGGVAADFLTLTHDWIDTEKTQVVVTKKADIDEFYGLAVKALEDLKVVDPTECYVIVAVMGDAERSIVSELQKLGIENYCTVDSFIEEMYQEIWKSGIHERKIMFSHIDGKQFGDNPKYILEEICRRSFNADLVWVVERKDAYPLPDGVRAVPYGTYDYYWELGTSKIWIDDKHKNFFSRKRENQIYIQTWHGGGPLKKIEFDAEETLPQSYLALCERNSMMIDIMISPSGFNTQLYRRAFHYYGDVMECGYPRNDLFFQREKAHCSKKIKECFQVSEMSDILLFAPTFRSKGINEHKIDFEGVIRSYQRRYKRDLVIFVRLHPADIEHSDDYFVWNDHIINASRYDDAQELLAGADLLITDYSSIMCVCCIIKMRKLQSKNANVASSF